MKFLAILALFATSCPTKSEVRYDGFELYRVVPTNAFQLTNLQVIQDTMDSYKFWTNLRGANKTVDILVPPHLKEHFQDLVKRLSLNAQLQVENVQKLIDREKGVILRRGHDYNWETYLTLEKLYKWLRLLAARHPDLVTVVKGGSTYEGREILGVKLTFNASNKDVIIEGGIHAREWISTATVTYIANELVNSQNATVRKIAESFNWHLFPSINPDGYVYTYTSDRLWRKNRKPYGKCTGVDLNRNWGYKWLEGGASTNPCLDTFAGSSAFSEIESKSFSQYISKIVDNVEAYIAFHSYSQLLLMPFGHGGLEVPNNNDELNTIGKEAIAALAKRYGTVYKFGHIPKVVYVASGGSTDWVLSSNRNIKLVYTYELRDQGKYGFSLPPEQIIPNCEEVFDSLVVMFQQIL